MSRQTVDLDQVSIQIERELQNVRLRERYEFSISRVNVSLRKQNEKAYEPSTVTIGPYHYGKKELNWMEHHKLRYLDLLLQRSNSKIVKPYIKEMILMEQKARTFYADLPAVLDDSNKFARMMLLDGCFIIEFCRKFMPEHTVHPDDYIVQTGSIAIGVLRDLILLENQLPFCVLEKLFDLSKDNNNLKEKEFSLVDLIFHALRVVLPSSEVLRNSDISSLIVGPNLKNSHGGMSVSSTNSSSISVSDVNVIHVLSLVQRYWKFRSVDQSVPKSDAPNEEIKWDFISYATELSEGGIKFAVAEKSVPLFDIKFESGVLKIPRLNVMDETETVFRNLIAYEQCSRPMTSHVTHYIVFLDRLINSAKDVEKLRSKNIIVNWLGDDEAVSNMVNKLANNVGLVASEFCYAEIFNQVNSHRGARRNIWLEKLTRNYFHSPWSIISFLAAFALLILTLLQAIFTILSYKKSE